MGPELTIAGWFVSSIIKNLVSTIYGYIKDQPNWQLGMKDELKRLQKQSPKIEAVVKAFERIQMLDDVPELNQWLWQLKDATEQAENLLDELDYMRLKEELNMRQNKVCYSVNLLRVVIKRALKSDPFLKKLKKIVEELDEVAADAGHFLNLVNASRQQRIEIWKRRMTSSFPYVDVEEFSRKEEMEELIEALTDPNYECSSKNVHILPIIGVGGIGKTTLAQQVYQDFRISGYFTLMVWVCVSNNFDVHILTKRILESICCDHERVDFDNLDVIQAKLKTKLSSERYLLVMDDVWNDNVTSSWEKLFAPLKFGQRGSKVLLTTRLRGVADMMAGMIKPVVLKGLENDKYLSLFEKCAFVDEDPADHAKLRFLGRQIAKRLGGSPLAAKTVGAVLHSNLDDDHWARILRSNISDIEQEEDGILSVLKLSYQHLPAYLRPCFTFCSVFPQDYAFEKEKLIQMWIAAGFIPKPLNGKDRWEDIGESYFDELFRRSFFDKKSSLDLYTMHDLLHNLACHLSNGECFRLVSDVSLKIPETVRHLWIDRDDFAILEELRNLKYLRTLFLFSSKSGDELTSILRLVFDECVNLRVFKLAVRYLDKFPNGVSNLIHLRYLDLSDARIQELPKSFFSLYHLQVLNVMHNRDDVKMFRNLEKGSKRLINLRHLIGHPDHISLISGVGNLTALQELGYLCVKKAKGYSIAELENMNELQKLHIKNLQNVRSREEAGVSKLTKKVKLRRLALEWDQSHHNTSELQEETLDALQPNIELGYLNIISYSGNRSPIWMESFYLINLTSLSLTQCSQWKVLPPLGELPYLKFLYIKSMFAVEQIDDHFYGRDKARKTFPSLNSLKIKHMPKLKNWKPGTGFIEWFPRLSKIEISVCPELKELPPMPLNLEGLHIFLVGLCALPSFRDCCGQANNWLRCHGSSCRSSTSSVSLSRLSDLSVSYCDNLTSLSEGLLQHQQVLKDLQKLEISGCKALVRLPSEGFHGLTTLEKLEICGCPKLHIPEMMVHLYPPSLQDLLLEEHNGDIQKSLPRSFHGLTTLSKLSLWHCSDITTLSSVVWCKLTGLQDLWILYCEELKTLTGLDALVRLQSLQIEGCAKLVENSEDLHPLDRTSSSASCDTAKKEGTYLSHIEYLVIDNPLLLLLPDLAGLTIRRLEITSNAGLKCLSVYFDQWLNLRGSSLEELILYGLLSLQYLPASLGSLPSLQQIHLSKLSSLRSLPASLGNLPVLQSLHLVDLPLLQSLPELPASVKVSSPWGELHPELE